jgi:hypothetical protein
MLMLEPYVNNVYVESPPSDDLPRFDRVKIPSCKATSKLRRNIYLRPGDTVHFQDHQCALLISAGKVDYSSITSFAESDKVTTAPEIQVKSSAHQLTTGPGASIMEDEETEDEDDLDDSINTPLGAEDAGNLSPDRQSCCCQRNSNQTCQPRKQSCLLDCSRQTRLAQPHR